MQRPESLNHLVDRIFEKFNAPIKWLAWCAIAYLLVRLIVASYTGH